MISCREWRPWTKPGCITMTRRQSNNQWSGDIAAHPAPKNSECKNPMQNFSPRFFGIKTASPSLIIFQRAKQQSGVLLTSAGAIEGHFEGKTPRKVTKVFLVLHDNAPAHRALATQKKLAYLGFHCLGQPPYSPNLAPSDYHLFPGLKNNWKVTIFRPTRRSLLPRRSGWTENLLTFFFFLSGFQKLEQRVKKFIELRGEYVE